jgi:hypothetical protein
MTTEKRSRTQRSELKYGFRSSLHGLEFKSRASVRIHTWLDPKPSAAWCILRIRLHASKGPQLSRSIRAIVVRKLPSP